MCVGMYVCGFMTRRQVNIYAVIYWHNFTIKSIITLSVAELVVSYISHLDFATFFLRMENKLSLGINPTIYS
jgi:hypothetical protein